MTDSEIKDLTIEILLEIRNEMRLVRTSLEALDARVAALETRIESLDTRIESLETRVGNLESRVGSLETRIERLERRFDKLENRVEIIHHDLRKFASVVNETVLHYAEEMDSVRDRLSSIESKLGPTPPSE
ncbi:MAG: hypothetical protein AB1473_12360 [Thermodesulfobacteriota bacterium]